MVAALTLALVIPTLDGLRVAGVAAMIELPDEPRAGDCLLATPTSESGTAGASTGLLGPTFASCEGRDVDGEVVAVVDGPGSAPNDAAVGGMDCRRSALEYGGVVLTDGRPLSAGLYPSDVISWNLAISIRAAVLVPSPLLHSAGQTWIACIAAPVNGVPYQGQLAGAFNGGTLPSEFGVCVAERRPSVFIEPVPCKSPHFAEVISTATVPGGGRTAVADIKSSCERIAARVIGRSDPTASGQLTAEASITPAAGQFLALPQPLDISCYISSVTRPLSGTLVGLGGRPIPFQP